MARSFWKVWANPGAKATAETPETSPPENAEVDSVLTTIVSGFPTQWPAVRTRVGEITVPVQSVVGVSTAAAKGHWSMLAGVPPITLDRARGLADPSGAASNPINPMAHRSAAPVRASRDRIVVRVEAFPDLALNPGLAIASRQSSSEGENNEESATDRCLRHRLWPDGRRAW